MFYSIFDVAYQGTWMSSMFSVRDPAQHAALRRPVAQKFSMSSMKAMEPFADECNEIFINAMKELEAQKVDLSTWLQWYAFDVISALTFHRRFGFMEERRDVENMIKDISQGLVAAAAVSQVPRLHPWLMGSRWLPTLLAAQPFFRVPDPLRTVVKFTEDCIADYDRNPPSEHRPDFMSWLRQVNVKGESMSDPDFVNHLSNNLLAGSDTTAISLRAVLYFQVQNPGCYRKAQEEVDEADNAGKLSDCISYAECLQLPYLQAVMKEAMRCHPGVSYPLERVVPHGGADICGVHLMKGTIVGVNPAVIHRDTSIFGDDAIRFSPERWLTGNEERTKLMDRNLMTMSFPRACIVATY
ncbi:hypothetical protein LTR17_022371 [Elasticomyces elasticus]|nr:hypothetical protein LTR17_022371 [Elasticomyces elasticus]